MCISPPPWLPLAFPPPRLQCNTNHSWTNYQLRLFLAWGSQPVSVLVHDVYIWKRQPHCLSFFTSDSSRRFQLSANCRQPAVPQHRCKHSSSWISTASEQHKDSCVCGAVGTRSALEALRLYLGCVCLCALQIHIYHYQCTARNAVTVTGYTIKPRSLVRSYHHYKAVLHLYSFKFRMYAEA